MPEQPGIAQVTAALEGVAGALRPSEVHDRAILFEATAASERFIPAPSRPSDAAYR